MEKLKLPMIFGLPVTSGNVAIGGASPPATATPYFLNVNSKTRVTRDLEVTGTTMFDDELTVTQGDLQVTNGNAEVIDGDLHVANDVKIGGTRQIKTLNIKLDQQQSQIDQLNSKVEQLLARLSYATAIPSIE